MTLIHGSLFSGIGGFDLGFERCGIETIWQVEIDEYCQKVLERHFPDAKRFRDIKDCGKHNLEKVDIISGGFPCQDISVAGKRTGITGSRSGLWTEMYRILGELRPQYAVIENVPNLIKLGLETVLYDLASIGYDAEWQIISANDVGAPHLRKRIWIIAYPPGDIRGTSRDEGSEAFNGCGTEISDSTRRRERALYGEERGQGQSKIRRNSCQIGGENDWWTVEPDVGRVAHGVRNRVDRLKGLGNAIVPQIAEYIGRLILDCNS